jgi:hypothetical protein
MGSLWHRAGGTCIDFQALLASTGALNIFTNLVLLVIPIPLLLQLKVNTHKKLLILMAFAIGEMYVTPSLSLPSAILFVGACELTL